LQARAKRGDTVHKMIQHIKVKGELYSGLFKGEYFTQLDWVKRKMIEKVGFEPFPGTVNLRVSMEDFAFFIAIKDEGEILIPPSPQFCEAKLLKVNMNGIDAAAIFPEKKVWSYVDTLEIMAPVFVRKTLGVRDGDILIVDYERRFVPKAIFFDLDGTIVDSVRFFYELGKEVFKKIGLPEPNQEKLREIMKFGKSPWDILIPEDIDDRQKIIERGKRVASEIFIETYEKVCNIFHNVPEVLKTLHGRGFKTGIITAARWDLKPVVERLFAKNSMHMEELFDTAVARPDGSLRPKPFPDTLLKACEKLSLAPWECVYVGDTTSDIRTGKAAKMATVGVLTGVGTREEFFREAADAIIENLSGLISIMEAH
jgi:phosphoglycolate phosphatase-like HAD superfamily hydrolase